MSQDPDRLRQEIEQTRQDLSHNVDALTGKVNPRRVAEERMGRARGMFGNARDKIMGGTQHASEMGRHAGDASRHAAAEAGHQISGTAHAMRERAEGSPLAAGLIAFGTGLLAASLLRPSCSEHRLAERAKHTAQAHSGQLRQQAGQAGQQMRDALSGPAHEAVDAVRSRSTQAASAVREQGRSAAAGTRSRAQQAQEELRHR